MQKFLSIKEIILTATIIVIQFKLKGHILMKLQQELLLHAVES